MSYSYAIFNETLRQIEQHKEQNDEIVKSRTSKAYLWWKSLPDLARQNLIDHSFLKEPTIKDISDFYWGD